MEVNADAAIAALQDHRHWPRWVPGLLEHGVPAPGEVRCSLQGPIPLSLHLQLTKQSNGLAFSLVEGDLADVHGTVTVHERDGQVYVAWDVAVAAPIVVPAPLWRELQDETLPRWTQALVRFILAGGAN